MRPLIGGHFHQNTHLFGSDTMDQNLIDRIKKNDDTKETAKLIREWKENSTVYSEEAFEAMKQILTERGVPIPAQNRGILPYLIRRIRSISFRYKEAVNKLIGVSLILLCVFFIYIFFWPTPDPDWEKATTLKTTKGYFEYINSHPDGLHEQGALKAIDRLFLSENAISITVDQSYGEATRVHFPIREQIVRQLIYSEAKHVDISMRVVGIPVSTHYRSTRLTGGGEYYTGAEISGRIDIRNTETGSIVYSREFNFQRPTPKSIRSGEAKTSPNAAPFDVLINGSLCYIISLSVGEAFGEEALIKALAHAGEDIELCTEDVLSKPFYGSGRKENLLIATAKSNSVIARKRASHILGNIKSMKAIETLSKLVAVDPESSVRIAAANALGEIGNKTAVSALIESLNVPNTTYFIRAAISDSLERLTGKDYGGNYEKWKKWFEKGDQ